MVGDRGGWEFFLMGTDSSPDTMIDQGAAARSKAIIATTIAVCNNFGDSRPLGTNYRPVTRVE